MNIKLGSIFEKIKKNKLLAVSTIGIGILLGVYMGLSIFFINHFTFGTYINGIEVSGCNIEDVKKELANKVNNYSLVLDERDNEKETINSSDINLQYVEDGKVEDILKKQNPFGWIATLIGKDEYEVKSEIKYDSAKLQEVINNLKCINNTNVIKPVNASIKYDGDKFVIVDEVLGNVIDKEKVQEVISQAITEGEEKISLDKKDCYINPTYTKNSKKLKESLDTANKYIKTKVIYDFKGESTTLDKEVINTWITLDDECNVSISDTAIRNYVDKLSSKFNTYGNSRKFKTSNGNTLTISKGDYGWIVNKSKEISELKELVTEGQTTTKEPNFSQKAAVYSDTNDYGNTYVEINLATQHLWLYKNGNKILETDIVSGSMLDPSTVTPDGIYYVKYKERNATLKGEGYEQPVAYWMPFNGGIGMHDADSWRDKYGGDIYLTNGSHGCVNMPLGMVAQVYDNINAGTPVICYYDYNVKNK